LKQRGQRPQESEAWGGSGRERTDVSKCGCALRAQAARLKVMPL